MKKKLFFIIVFFAFLLDIYSQGSFLWEVRSKTNTVYLLGSIHLASEDIHPLPKIYDKSFKRSKVLVVEANVLQQDPSLQMMIMQLGMYEPGTTDLRQEIPEVVFEKFEKTMQELELPVENFLMMRPWLIAFTLVNISLQKLGIQPQYGVDIHYLNKAEKRPIKELEGIAAQLEMLGSLSKEEQLALLEGSLESIDFYEEQFKNIIDLWVKGDHAGLNEMLNESRKGSPESEKLMDTIMDERNKDMVQKIESYLSEKKNIHFVIAGAGHFVGEKGIVEILKEKGYRVKNLK